MNIDFKSKSLYIILIKRLRWTGRNVLWNISYYERWNEALYIDDDEQPFINRYGT